jgi:hypothetical protein
MIDQNTGHSQGWEESWFHWIIGNADIIAWDLSLFEN